MKVPRLLYCFTLLLLVANVAPTIQASSCADHKHPVKTSFIANMGQWTDQVIYKAAVEGGLLYVENAALTFAFYDPEDMAQLHDYKQMSAEQQAAFCINGFAYKIHFANAQTTPINGERQQSEYYNYFMGNDATKWASRVPLFEEVRYQQVYEGIGMRLYHQKGNLKYDFEVAANADVSQIQLHYEGLLGMKLVEGHLELQTTLGDIIESKPIAYQWINGVKQMVACNYVLTGEQLTFAFPEGYNKALPLVIDPEVVAATLSGTTGFGSNYGHCATFDEDGNIFTGAISFNTPYPTTTGAFQQTYAGGNTDIAISKLNAAGTNLLWATFIGGNGADYPHSMMADNEQNLYVYGTSSSGNYPTTAAAFQPSFGGGSGWNGGDIVISKLQADGSALVGSTYMGGNGSDGNNESDGLYDNYGDEYRGEIIVDDLGHCYVTSCTQSTNFPVTSGAIQTTLNQNPFTVETIWGGTQPGTIFQDAVVFKLDETLSTLLWSTYLGGTGIDNGYGLRFLEDNTVYVTGTAGADDFPTTADALHPTFLGGNRDAFVTHLNANGTEVLHSTFWGTAENDQGFFIDTDVYGNIAIYGQSAGDITVTPGTYSNPGSKQFVSTFDASLSNLVYSTVLGNGSGSSYESYDFVPVAFLVDNCGYIYISGYSATWDLPLTPDALYTTGGFYLLVLEESASNLFFSTYYSADHVDGGTSRFDKRGIVYQAVCSGGGFTTNPDAWATTQSSGWDIGIFKIDFQTPVVAAVSSAAPQSSGCVPLTVNFSNAGSSSANTFYWDFDDGGATSFDEEPIHTFTQTGLYEVILIASDSTSCNLNDTSRVEIVVLDPLGGELTEVSICDESIYVCDVTVDGATYSWHDGSTAPTFTASETGIYWVEISVENCTQIDSFVVNYIDFSIDLGPDQTLCETEITILDATNVPGSIYIWQDGSNEPTYSVSQAGTYTVLVQTGGCVATDTVEVFFDPLPFVDLGEDQIVCDGETVNFDVTTPDALYEWQDGSTEPTLEVIASGTYSVDVTVNGCTVSDMVNVIIADLPPQTLGEDQSVCEGEVVVLDAFLNNDALYEWQDGSTSSSINATETGIYWVDLFVDGCVMRDSVAITVHPIPTIDLGADRIICEGDETLLDASLPDATYLWQDGSTEATMVAMASGNYSVEVTVNGCVTTDELNLNFVEALEVPELTDATLCAGEVLQADVSSSTANEYLWDDGTTTPTRSFTQTGNYFVDVSNECETIRRSIQVTFEGLAGDEPLLMPTGFSPNDDGLNDIFRPVPKLPITEYHFAVYNRWGEKVFETTELTDGWDGEIARLDAETGVYVWYYTATVEDCEATKELFQKGNVTLVR